MTIKLFHDLNREWSRTVKARRTAEALNRWSVDEPPLREFADLQSIVDRAHDPDRTRRDGALAALIRTGHADPLAWRAVLQVVMPGLVSTTARFVPGPHTAEEVAATVVAAAWQRIATYPLDRRPRNIGGNIVLDARQIASKKLFRNAGVEQPSDELWAYRAAPAPRPDPAARLLEVLQRAVRSDVVSVADARLVALTRIHDVPVDELAAERGILPHSLRRHRLRVEARLSAAVA